jgi:hypothetical protein
MSKAKTEAEGSSQPTSVPVAIDEPQVKVETKSSDNVCVALNMPHGVRFDLPGNKTVVIYGNAHHLVGKDKGVLPIGGYGLTLVAKADWEYIKTTWKGMAIFEKGLIFATDSVADSQAEAKKLETLRNGFEPVSPISG